MTARSVRRALERKRAKQARKQQKQAAPAAMQNIECNATPETEASARISANRINAQLSTDPRTTEGKLRSSLNALTSPPMNSTTSPSASTSATSSNLPPTVCGGSSASPLSNSPYSPKASSKSAKA